MPNWTPNEMRYPMTPTMPRTQQLSPVSAFMMSLQQSLVPILQYKMQQQMENDAYEKKRKIEEMYAERKAAQAAAAQQSDPKYQLEQDKLNWLRGLPQDKREQMYGVEAGIVPKAEPVKPLTPREEFVNKYFERIRAGVGGDPVANAVGRSAISADMGVPASVAEQLIPKTEEELTLDSARDELGLVNKNIQATTLENDKMERDRERDIALQMRARSVDRTAAAKLVDEKAAGLKDEKAAGLEGGKSDFTTFYIGWQKEHPDSKNPEAEASAAWHKMKQDEGVAQSAARGESFGLGRLYPTFDTEGNVIGYTQGKDIVKGKPGEFAPAAPAQKALNQRTLIEDIRGTIGNTRDSVKNLKTDFSNKMRTQLYFAVNATEPNGALSNLINGEFGKSLTTDQLDYLANVQVLVENAMAMRNILGAGQGSDELRRAIKQTIPSSGTFSKEFAMKQLDLFERTLDRLSKNIPTNVQLPGTKKPWNEMVNPAPTGTSNKIGRFTVEVE